VGQTNYLNFIKAYSKKLHIVLRFTSEIIKLQGAL
jgi:hypothetical protein